MSRDRTVKRGVSRDGTVKRGVSRDGTVKRGVSRDGTVKRGCKPSSYCKDVGNVKTRFRIFISIMAEIWVVIKIHCFGLGCALLVIVLKEAARHNPLLHSSSYRIKLPT